MEGPAFSGNEKGDVRNAHVELDKRCMVCQQDPAAKHHILKTLKLACLKYSSSPIKVGNKAYPRMKLLEIVGSMIRENSFNLN